MVPLFSPDPLAAAGPAVAGSSAAATNVAAAAAHTAVRGRVHTVVMVIVRSLRGSAQQLANELMRPVSLSDQV